MKPVHDPSLLMNDHIQELCSAVQHSVYTFMRHTGERPQFVYVSSKWLSRLQLGMPLEVFGCWVVEDSEVQDHTVYCRKN